MQSKIKYVSPELPELPRARVEWGLGLGAFRSVIGILEATARLAWLQPLGALCVEIQEDGHE